MSRYIHDLHIYGVLLFKNRIALHTVLHGISYEVCFGKVLYAMAVTMVYCDMLWYTMVFFGISYQIPL